MFPDPACFPAAVRSRRDSAGVAGRACGHRLAGAALLLALASCGRPGPVAPPTTPTLVLSGREVTWTSSVPSRGAVRYRLGAGRDDRVAYPDAADRGDLEYGTAHRVRLLDVAPGESVYVQALDQRTDGEDVASAEFGFRVGSDPVPVLLRWTMVDVGFGDSHLLTMPGTGLHVLVDAGERRDADNVLRALAAEGVPRLDVVVATHIHEDHIGGFVGQYGDPNDGVLGVLPAGVLLDAPDHSGSRSAYDELLSLAARRGVPRVVIHAGDTDAGDAALAWDPGVRVEVLHAGGGRALGGETESDWINDDSIVLRVGFGDVHLVLGADAETPAEQAILATGMIVSASALKVHHHGSADAADPAYLAAVQPRVGLIPIVAYESFNGSLPSGVVLARLRAMGVDVYASDRADPLGIAPAGDAGANVTLVTDGRSYEVHFEPSESDHWPPDEYHPASQGGSR